MKPITTRQLAPDAVAVLLVSLGVLTVADRPLAMWAILGAALVLRFAWWARVHPERALGPELAFFALCTLVGAFNDLNTVMLHGVYAYGVPAELPQLSSIPLWMLVFWGLILRFVFALTRWGALGPPEEPGRVVLGRRSVSLELGVIAAVVIVTRLSLFAHFESPILSWLPFAVALVAYALLVGADRHDLKLAALALVVGPVVEALYIQVGGLHAYALGWFAGVPLWIVLWWALATWIVKDLAARGYAALERAGSRGLARSRAATSRGEG